MYNVFGSSANHGIYAQFMAQSALSNSGRAVGLLCGAGTQMALWFYAMIRLLRVRKALTATIHQQKFADLSVKENVAAAVCDITDDKFWKRIYTVMHAVFPALRLLRYCECVILPMKCFGNVYTLFYVLFFLPFVCFAIMISPHQQWTKILSFTQDHSCARKVRTGLE